MGSFILGILFALPFVWLVSHHWVDSQLFLRPSGYLIPLSGATIEGSKLHSLLAVPEEHTDHSDTIYVRNIAFLVFAAYGFSRVQWPGRMWYLYWC